MRACEEVVWSKDLRICTNFEESRIKFKVRLLYSKSYFLFFYERLLLHETCFVKFLYVNSCYSLTWNHIAYINCIFLKIYVVSFLTIAFIKFMWPYCCPYLLLAEGKSWISLERRYAYTIKKALMEKAVSLRDNESGVCMSSMRSGWGDMVRDLLRGAMLAPLGKLSLEKADMFTRCFGIVFICFPHTFYTYSCQTFQVWRVALRERR